MPTDNQSHIGHWVQGRLLGRGGSGRVYLAQLSDGRPAACKVINTEGIAQDETSSLMGEIALIRGLRHQNIVRYLGYELDKHAHRLHIFLEYAHGGSVQQLTQAVGALDEATSRHFAAQILSGLNYLHAHGIAHRDIKGANVLLSAAADFPSHFAAAHTPRHSDHLSLVAKLADFGASKQIADMLDSKQQQQQQAPSSGLKGTPHWMAPEVIRGELDTASLNEWTKADVWSVGCTTVEMLTGEMPWPRLPNPMAAMYKIAEGHTPPMDHITTSPAARDFINACCASRAAERPSPAELLRHSFIVPTAQDRRDQDIMLPRKRMRNTEEHRERPPSCTVLLAMRHYHCQHRRQRDISAQIRTSQDKHDQLMLQGYDRPHHLQRHETASNAVAKRGRAGSLKLRHNNSHTLPPIFAGVESKRQLPDTDSRYRRHSHRIPLADNTLGRFGEAMLTQLDVSHQRPYGSIATRQSRSAGLQDLGKPGQQLPPIQATDRRQVNTAPTVTRNTDQAREGVQQQDDAAAEHQHFAQLRRRHYRQGSSLSPGAGTVLAPHPRSENVFPRHRATLRSHDHHGPTASCLPLLSHATSAFGGPGSNLAASAAPHHAVEQVHI